MTYPESEVRVRNLFKVFYYLFTMYRSGDLNLSFQWVEGEILHEWGPCTKP